MEKYLVPAAPPSQQNPPKSITKRPRWKRCLVELIGKFDSNYRHDLASLVMRSYSQIGAFPHDYHMDGLPCQTHVEWFAGVTYNQRSMGMQGISSLEFDSKGIYLASVTKSGCLTVHDFDALYCPVSLKNSVVEEDETKQVMHIFTGQTLDVVKWNLANQDEVASTSRKSGELYIYDIGYISSEPIDVLKKRPTIGVHGCAVQKGLSDIAFCSNEKSRVFASDMLGMVSIWDRRMSNLPCLDLTTNSTSAINSIEFNIDNQVIFGASKHGIIYMWDLRGGSSSSAFQNNKVAYYSPITSVKLASEFEKIGSLKAQSSIVSKEILSINLNPFCPYQLAFHLDDGWSGVFDVHNMQVTHVHCPPPAWLDGFDDLANLSYMRKPSWLPFSSIYAVGPSSGTGLHLLDFYQDRTSPCHVDFNEDLSGIVPNGQYKQNKFIPLPEAVTVCAAHPVHGAIVAGTKQSSLLLLSQESMQCQGGDDSPI